MTVVPGTSSEPARAWLSLPMAAFVLTLLLFCWRNDFPYFYHSDEESKSLQVAQNYRNYWHPLLLVNATEVLARSTGKMHDVQAVTECGRFFSALCGAGAVAALTLLALRRHGPATALAVALFFGTLPLLFELAHYVKEDPALLLGLSLLALAADYFEKKPGRRELAFLAVACAIATSAKYIGALTLPVACVIVLTRVKERRLQMLGIFLLIYLASLAVINWQMVLHSVDAWIGLTRETKLLESGHNGMAGSLPHWIYLEMFTNSMRRWMIWMAVWGLGVAWKRSGLRSVDTALAVGGMVYFVGLCYTAKASDRYLLPSIAACLYFFAVGLVALTTWLPAILRWPVVLAVLLTAWWPQRTMLENFRREFTRDSRGELVAWAGKNLPPGSRIVTSLWTRLPGDSKGQISGEPPPKDFVADRGTFAELRAQGFTHAAVADTESARFETNGKYTETGSDPAFLRRQEFYRVLQQQPILWQLPLGRIYVLHPGLRLYPLPE